MLAEDIAQYLASKGLGVLGTNIGVSFPPSPDDFMTIRVYGGEPPEYAKGTGALARRPRVQVAARSRDTRAALLRAEAAFGHLSGFSGMLNGTAYSSIRALGEPMLIGADENGRERAVVNFECLVQ